MASSFSVPYPKSALLNGSQLQQQLSKISFGSNLKSGNVGFMRSQGASNVKSAIWKVQAQDNEVVEKSTNSASIAEDKLVIPSSEEKVMKEEKPAVPNASAIAAFMAQVSDLVKLVDSRDITELQLKQQDCELVIRKKEALPQPPAPVYMMQPHTQNVHPSQPPPPPAAPAAASPAASAPALPAPPKANKSSHPPLKCPMAGTFYRCPGPGEPPFVKVGDKIQKGQVVCIVEAMKLMNEIEADSSGTLVEILLEDGKPVSVDTPLFVIEP
ncbi:hypothetical protein ACHQM5_006536 [Ranunculus cassubicifolius]